MTTQLKNLTEKISFLKLPAGESEKDENGAILLLPSLREGQVDLRSQKPSPLLGYTVRRHVQNQRIPLFKQVAAKRGGEGGVLGIFLFCLVRGGWLNCRRDQEEYSRAKKKEWGKSPFDKVMWLIPSG